MKAAFLVLTFLFFLNIGHLVIANDACETDVGTQTIVGNMTFQENWNCCKDDIPVKIISSNDKVSRNNYITISIDTIDHGCPLIVGL